MTRKCIVVKANGSRGDNFEMSGGRLGARVRRRALSTAISGLRGNSCLSLGHLIVVERHDCVLLLPNLLVALA